MIRIDSSLLVSPRKFYNAEILVIVLIFLVCEAADNMSASKITVRNLQTTLYESAHVEMGNSSI